MKKVSFLAIILILLFALCLNSCNEDISKNSEEGSTPVANEIDEFQANNTPTPESLNVDLFKDLIISFSGWDNYGSIDINTDNCSDFIKNYVSYEVENIENGNLSNRDIVIINAKYDEEYASENNYIIKSAQSTEIVTGLLQVNKASNFSDDRAWIEYEKDGVEYLSCIDKTGNMVFQFEKTLISKYENFSGGYAYIYDESEKVYIIDKSGLVTTINADIGERLAHGEGYSFYVKNISDIDNNYDRYYIYDDLNGEILYSTSILRDGKMTSGMLRSVNYCGDGIFGMSIRGEWNDTTWFYCAKANIMRTDLQGNTNAKTEKGIACIDIEYHDTSETGYRSSLKFLNSNGESWDVPVLCDGWNWQQSTNVLDNACVLYSEYYGEMACYDLSSNSFSSISGYYFGKIDWDSLGEVYFNDGIIALPIKGDNGNSYIAVFDKKWNIIIPPTEYFYVIGNSDGRLIVKKSDDTYIYDNSGKEVFTLSSKNLAKISAYSNGVAHIDGITYVDVNGNLLFTTVATDKVKTISLNNNYI